MRYCVRCRNLISTNTYLCPQCFQLFINGLISSLKPSDVKNIYCEDIFHEFMLNPMSDLLKKDINEALGSLACNFWTATVVMSARIFETQLKTHIYSDLDINDDVQNIAKGIKILKDRGYPQEFIDIFDELRHLRNLAMHGDKRFNSEQAIDTLKKVLIITTWIYNIPSI